MQNLKTLKILVIMIISFSAGAALLGIFSKDGHEKYEFTSIHGEKVIIYNNGLYRHMSADVAIQGIAQDCVTLIIAIPFLWYAFRQARKGSEAGKYLLAGVLGYFLVTYLFYLAMAMYNQMFLVYALLLCLSFFSFLITVLQIDYTKAVTIFSGLKLMRRSAIFLIANSIFIASLWLSIVVPPLISRTIYPKEIKHYTTLIVQGFDLGLFLPLAFVSGFLALKNNRFGLAFTPVYIIFLSFLMTALCSKLLFMALAGVNVIPAVFIIPVITIAAIIFSVLLLGRMKYHLTKTIDTI